MGRKTEFKLGTGEKDKKRCNREMNMKAGNGLHSLFTLPFGGSVLHTGLYLSQWRVNLYGLRVKCGAISPETRQVVVFSFSYLAVNRDSGYKLVSSVLQMTQHFYLHL